MHHKPDEDCIWYVCRYCGRSSVTKETIAFHEYEIHFKADCRPKPRPCYIVRKASVEEVREEADSGNESSWEIPDDIPIIILPEHMKPKATDDKVAAEKPARHLRKVQKKTTAVVKNNGQNLTTKSGKPILKNSFKQKARVNNSNNNGKKMMFKTNSNMVSAGVVVCQICNLNFSHNYIKIHRMSHTNEKPFKCSYCDYASQFRNALRLHEITHAGETPYACKFCTARFANKPALTNHQLRLHSNEI